jgi:hypothetical protein
MKLLSTTLLLLVLAYTIPAVKCFTGPFASLKDPFADHKTVKYPFKLQDITTRRTALLTGAAAVALTPDLRHIVKSTILPTKPIPDELQSRLNEVRRVWYSFLKRRYRPQHKRSDRSRAHQE